MTGVRLLLRLLPAATAVALLSSAPAAQAAVPTQFSGAGSGPAHTAMSNFTAAIAGSDNAARTGSQPGGYRTIDWEGLPDSVLEPRVLPPDYFNTASPRGVLLSTPGDSLRVSGGSGGSTTYPVFADVNSNYASDFAAFSGSHIFSPFGSTITDVRFVTAGGSAPATVRGFGAAFTNVEASGATINSIEYFDPSGATLGRYFAPTSSRQAVEFLGELFSTEQVARVRITSGTDAARRQRERQRRRLAGQRGGAGRLRVRRAAAAPRPRGHRHEPHRGSRPSPRAAHAHRHGERPLRRQVADRRRPAGSGRRRRHLVAPPQCPPGRRTR